jgi:hypothetical protein
VGAISSHPKVVVKFSSKVSRYMKIS